MADGVRRDLSFPFGGCLKFIDTGVIWPSSHRPILEVYRRALNFGLEVRPSSIRASSKCSFDDANTRETVGTDKRPTVPAVRLGKYIVALLHHSRRSILIDVAPRFKVRAAPVNLARSCQGFGPEGLSRGL
jgi:hypothetical protein